METGGGGGARPVVLVVDDDRLTRGIAREQLEAEGFGVAEAADGPEAVARFAELRPDLVLLDVVLPGYDGFKVCDLIRTSPPGEHTPVLMMTGLGDVGSITRAYAVLATDFITKPVNWVLLRHRLRYLLRAGRALRALAESEQELFRFLESLPLGVCVATHEGELSFANSRARDMLGLGALIGRRLERVVDAIPAQVAGTGEPYPRELLPIVRALAGERSRVDDMEVVRGGERLLLEVTGTPIRDGQGTLRYALATFDDITGARRAAAELRNLSLAVEQSASAVVITDARGRIEYVNPAFTATTGYTAAEAIGRTPSLLKSGAQTPEFYRGLWGTVTDGRAWRGELKNRRKDGTTYWDESVIAPVADEQGRITHFIAVKEDVTERKRTEEALRVKDSAIASSLNAIALADLEGALTYVNPAFLRLWGYPAAAEVLGRPVGEFWQVGEQADGVVAALRRGGGWVGELLARRKDGSSVEVMLSASLVRDGGGRPLCMMASFVDISPRRRAEAAEREQRRMAEALRATAESLNSSLDYEEVIGHILGEIGRVVPSDAATLMMIDGSEARVARHRGFAAAAGAPGPGDARCRLEDYEFLETMRATRQPAVIADTQADARALPCPEQAWIRSCAGVPICVREQVAGFLVLYSAEPGFFTEEGAARLKVFANQAAIAIENARLYAQAHHLSITDTLTGLANRHHFFDLGRREFERIRRYGGEVAIVLMDLDHFKRVNDSHGHAVGDEVLRDVARRVRGTLRAVDVAGRYGGEEFVVLMPETGREEACRAAERMREAVAAAPVACGELALALTLSLGVASAEPCHRSLDELIKCADDALYEAKAAGRNRVAAWRPKP